MFPPRNIAVLAGLAAVFLGTAASAVPAPKLDARLLSRRAEPASGGFAVMGGGGAGGGPRRSVLIRVSPGTPLAALRAAFPGAEFGSQAGDVVTASADDAGLDALAGDARVRAIELGQRARPTMDLVRSSSTSGGLALGTIYGSAATDLAGATGAGVIVGVVDTGIDYLHQDFVTSGNASRVLYIWDQTIATHSATGGPFPSGYNYGVEYTQAQLTAKIGGSGTINTYDTDGHGTHVASIAAGDGSATTGSPPAGTFQGVAPAADLIVVKTTFDTPNVIDAVNYIVARAATAGKRAVINLSLGLQLGPHDGTSTFESAIGAVAANTPVVVAMGNDAALKPHAGIDVGFGGAAGVVIGVDASPIYFADAEFWHPGGDAYTVSVVLSGVSGSLSTVANSSATATLSGHVIKLYNGFNPAHPSGDKQVFVSVDRPAGFTASAINVTFSRTVNGGTGRIDGWVDPGAQGVSFASYVDNTRTLGEPACAQNVFGVASYAGKKYWNSINGNTYNYTTQTALGGLSHFSSAGPTRDGRRQPEVAAPGDVVVAAMSANTSPVADYVVPDNRHRVLRGTSMATPVVAGILAARLQWTATRTVADLRAVLRAQARADGATGTVPNYSWGYGKAASSPQPVSPPTGLTAAAMGASSVTWSWNAVVGADSYRLYYSTNPSVLLAAVAASPYVHTALAANTTTGVLVKGVGGGVDGPGAFISTSTFAAAPAALPTATPHVDSATVSWTPCPAAPATVSCWGYSVSASTATDGGGVQYTAQTTNRALSSLAVTGLQPLTTYYFRQSTLNFYGAPTATGPVSATTLTDLVAPINPQFSGATTSEMRFDWSNPGNPPGVVYVAEASSSAVFAYPVASSSTKNVFAIVSGLATNTSYYFRVQATGGPYLAPAAPVATLAAAPAASTSPYSALSQTGFTVGWSTGANPPNTLYQAEISASASFTPLAGSSSTRGDFASFSGLTPNTVYYARALAISHGGFATAYTTFGSTPTTVLPPTLPAQPFSSQADDGFTFSFLGGGNPAGTNYLVRVSTEASLASVAASANTTATSASFTGLSSNRLYYAAVAALNASGTPTAFTGAVSTGTTVAAPAAHAAPLTGRSTGTLSVIWGASTLGPGTIYQAQSSAAPDFLVANSSLTQNTFATIAGALPNTIHYLRVRAKSLNAPNPDGPWLAIGQASTLANAPAAAGAPFPLVGVASVTVAWTSLPLAPQSASCAGYLVEASPAADFSSILRSSVVAAGAVSANLSGLAFATTYWFRVGSLDQEGDPNYLVIGSTRTGTPALSSATMTTGSLSLTLPAAFAVLPAVTAFIEAGTFPPGTVVSMLNGVTLDLTNPPSNVASLTALGTAVGVDISAGGLQPLKPVRLTMTYDPALLPPGQDARRLLIGRYDEAAARWTLAPSAVDTSARTIVASLDHFSAYAPFFAAAGAGLSEGLVFPQPWEPGEPGGSFGAQALTFANYPAGTKVRIMSLAGERIWEGTAAANGVLTWDGRNSSGRSVASGTYYAILESGGARKVRRVAVVR